MKHSQVTTGVLRVEQVTPLLKAVFGPLILEHEPLDGKVTVGAENDGDLDRSWGEVHDDLLEYAENAGIGDAAADSLTDLIGQLAVHCGREGSSSFEEGENESHETATLQQLYDLARELDDGHGLKAMTIEGAWWASKKRAFEFGGHGAHYGPEIELGCESNWVTIKGPRLDELLAADRLDEVAQVVMGEVRDLLAGIRNESRRANVRALLARILDDQEGEDLQQKWFAVSGRIPGDDEDVTYVFRARNQDEAVGFFADEIYSTKRDPEDFRERVFNEHGQEVFINSVVVSLAPMEAL